MNLQQLQINFEEMKQQLKEIDEFLKHTLWEEIRKKAEKEVSENGYGNV